jgi:uncharacterized protein
LGQITKPTLDGEKPLKWTMNHFFGRFGMLILQNRLVVTLLFLGLSSFLLAGIGELTVDFSARAFFAGEDEANENLQEFSDVWGPDDRLVLAVVSLAPDQSGTLLTNVHVDAMRQLASAFKDAAGVEEVVAATNVSFPQLKDEVLDFAPLIVAAPPKGIQAEAWRSKILSDTALVPTFVSEDGRHAAMGIMLAMDTDSIGKLRPLVTRLESIAQAHSGEMRQVQLAGMPLIRTGLLKLILTDQMIFIPTSFLIMALLLFILYRRFHGIIFPLTVAIIPVAMVMGVMGYLGTPIGVVNQVYFTLLPVIAVAGGVHFLSRYYEEAHVFYKPNHRLNGEERKASLIRTYKGVAAACFFSGTTTVVGLLSLQFSNMPVLKNFGLYSAIGVSLALLVLLVVLPIFLSITRGRILDARFSRRRYQGTKHFQRIFTFSIRHPKLCLGVTLAIATMSLYGGSLVNVDNSLSGMLGPNHPTFQTHNLLDNHLGGSTSLEIDLRAQPGFFQTVRALKLIEALENRARQEDAVRAAQSPVEIVLRLNATLGGERVLPATDAAVAQLFFLAEGRPEIEAFLNGDKSRARLTLRTKDVGCNAFVNLRDRLRTDFAAIRDQHGVQESEIKIVFTGTTLTSYLGVNQLSHDLRRSILGAFCIILVILMLVFRSAPLALLATIPNGIPLICGYGFLGFMGWNLEPGPAVVFTVAMGIAVDDTIHLILRFKEEDSKGMPIEKALQRSIWRSGRAVLITTIILAAGFAINGLSVFPTNQRVGILGATVVILALLADLFVLPPLLLLWKRRGKGT